jgi:hypothetical protein
LHSIPHLLWHILLHSDCQRSKILRVQNPLAAIIILKLPVKVKSLFPHHIFFFLSRHAPVGHNCFRNLRTGIVYNFYPPLSTPFLFFLLTSFSTHFLTLKSPSLTPLFSLYIYIMLQPPFSCSIFAILFTSVSCSN